MKVNMIAIYIEVDFPNYGKGGYAVSLDGSLSGLMDSGTNLPSH